MAAGTQNFPKILKSLREPSNATEKCEALTYIRSNSKKLESANTIKEEQFKELCTLVIDALSNGDDAIQHEAYETLNVMIRDFKNHDMKLFDAMLRANKKTRLKILKILEVCNDTAILALTFDSVAVSFFRQCMQAVQTKNMEWLTANACTDSLQPLIDAENAQLSPEQKLEEEIISHAMHFLSRLYKIAALTSELKVERFDTLVMEKVTLLAYMGHKRQRGPALKLLQHALSTDIGKNIRSVAPDLWDKYKSTLQTVYCKRMLLLVGACEMDWATQWNISIQILGTDLHRGAGLINNLLSVEEKAFKSIDTIIRRHAFLSWKLLVDNFALDPQELATARRIKLLCIPLNAKNSKTELIALTKLEVWWHVIIKLYKDITNFVNPMITQFLNFCFGPLGDTALLSSKYNVVASPGKRFYKTKVVAVDALCQLLVPKQVSQNGFSSILEERLPHSMTDAVFQACYKSVIHSVGEVLLILSQLTDAEMKSRYQVGKILWTSLVHYVQESKCTTKDLMCKNIILVITELINYAGDKSMIKDLFLDTILIDISQLCKGINLEDDVLPGLLMQVLQIPILEGAKKEHYNALKSILQYSVKSTPESSYRPNVLEFLNKLLETLTSSVTASSNNSEVALELWKMLADTLRKYMYDSQDINEGDSVKHSFKTVELTLRFPFDHVVVQDLSQIKQVSKIWKDVYRQFELQADMVVTVMPNEILLKTAEELRNCFIQNKSHCSLAIHCTEVLLSSINYTALLELEMIPAILELIVDLVPMSLTTTINEDSEIILKALSALLITVYGHDAGKVTSYLIASEPAVTAALSSESKALLKEVANMWETIVSIFKGLGEAVSYSLLARYKDVIIQALNHTNPDIESQAMNILDLQGSLKSNSNALLETIAKKAKKEKVGNKPDTTKKSKEPVGSSIKPVKIVGSFLGRNTASPTVSAVSQVKDKNQEKNIFIEPDSQDYVLIKTEVKFDINRLTEHQKESLKRRRDDIPALYNDLSQSSSQDTQNLQEWFDKKSKHITEAEDKSAVKKNDKTYIISDHDANKENKISATLPDITDKSSNVDSQVKSVANVAAEISTTDAGCNSEADTSTLEKEPKTIETHEAKSTEQKTNSDSPEKVSLNSCTVNPSVDESSKSSEEAVSSNPVVKKLNFESLEEFPESIVNESRLSPSILDSGRRRLRRTGQSKSDEDPTDATTSTVELSQRTRRVKATAVGKADGSKQISPEDSNAKKKSPEDGKRGVKRKLSETESSLPNVRRRRKLSATSEAINNDNISEAPQETGSSTTSTSEAKEAEKEEHLSQRTRKEMSRLRINMVFDCPLPERRRSKANEETGKEPPAKKSGPLEQKNLRSKTKGGDKDRSTPTSPQRTGTRRSKRSLQKTEADRNDDSAEGSGEDKRDSSNKDSEADTKSDNAEVASEETLLETDHDTKISKIINIVGWKKTPTESEIAISENNTAAKESIRKDLTDSGEKKLSGVTDVSSSEQESESQDDCEDVVESSQDTQELLKFGGKYKDKQCFIKINKIEPGNVVTWELLGPVHQNAIAGNNVIENSAVENNTASGSSPKSSHEESSGKLEQTANSANTDVDDNQQDEEKRMTNDMSKSNDTLPSAKNSLFGFVSPKGSIKRLSKFKSYSQGRAAHMLGLVTKQSKLEHDSQLVTPDDDATSAKKSKFKDTETETKKDRSSTSKETDKITTPCSSRQEKMFNNMKSTEFSSSSSMKLFSNLKNDGEKISPKLEKSINALDCASGSDGSLEKKREDNTSPTERDQLPILEWSSANPPSLTASPSASILKRNSRAVPEPDPECTTPNKRKRVSFADPPVSKEMGYQIIGNSSPHKINRLGTPRVLVMRRDSPVRLRQTRSKVIQMDPENSSLMETDSDPEIYEDIYLPNNHLSQITEEIERTADMSDQTIIYDFYTPFTGDAGKDARQKVYKTVTIDASNLELEITDTTVANSNATTLHTEANEQNAHSAEERVNIGNLIKLESSKVETQQDLFTENPQGDDTPFFEMPNDEKREDKKKSLPIVNTTLDSLKLDGINDSVIAALPKKVPSTDCLDDTVDANNLTGIDSSANSDEIFCGKLVRTSTQATENADEQDTLPVTDSVFGSLPLSQESQINSQYSMEVPRPETLDSTQPIYPKLISCTEPLKTIVSNLTNPLWVQYLASNLASRGLQTVGDLARLTEREVNRIPVKGNPKVEFVKNVLRRFESSNLEQTSTDMSEERKDQDSEDVKPCIDNTGACSMTMGVTSQEMETTLPTMSKDTLSHSTPLAMTSGNKTRNMDFDSKENFLGSQNGSLPSTLDIDSNCEKSFEDFAKPVIGKLSERSATNVGTSAEIPAGAQSTTSGSRPPVIMKSVGTCTDFMDPIILQSRKRTKSVEAQTALEDLLDEIDVNLVLESAARRCAPERLLYHYKNKMRHIADTELERETIKLLGLEPKQNYKDITLKAACRACGINKVLLRLPDIFGGEKQFFSKVLTTYCKKIKPSDCINVFDLAEVKDAVCQKCTSSELAEMLSNKLSQEEREGINKPIKELPSLNTILKRMPKDVIISHTVANDELIPSRVVLDIGLENNSPDKIAQALKQKPHTFTRKIFDGLWSPKAAVEHITNNTQSRDSLLEIFRVVSSQLSTEDLLTAYHGAMKQKLSADNHMDALSF